MQQHNKLHYVNKVYQTEAYQLNIIEKDDNFSTDPLNENMEKLDHTLLAAHMGAVAEHDQRTRETAALDQRVTALEVKKIAVGSYAGQTAHKTIDVGFTPIAVIIFPENPQKGGMSGMAVTDSPVYDQMHKMPQLAIIPNGFQVRGLEAGQQSYYDEQGKTYNYLALG